VGCHPFKHHFLVMRGLENGGAYFSCASLELLRLLVTVEELDVGSDCAAL
jgi:hypothetical protein